MFGPSTSRIASLRPLYLGLLVSGLLVLGVAACEREPLPPLGIQSSRVEVEQAKDYGPVVVPSEWETPFEDPAAPEELAAALPEFAALRPVEQMTFAKVLNVVPAPCVPCDNVPLARCGIEPPAGCENIPALIARAIRMVQAHEPPEKVRAAMSYADVWLPLPERIKDRSRLQVDVWMDPASPFAEPTLATVDKLQLDSVELVVHYLPKADSPTSLALAHGAIAAEDQGQLLPFLHAVEDWRKGERDAIRSGQDPLADGGLEAVASLLSSDGLNLSRWQADRTSPETAARVASDKELAMVAGVRAVPTWFVGGYRLRGAQSDVAVGRLIALGLEDIQAQKGH
jgi:hypothetical protein